MDRSLITRGIVILVVLLIAAFTLRGLWLAGILPASLVPEQTIKQGLDLQGGMHLVLQVRTDDALRAERDKDIDQLLQELGEREITGAEAELVNDTSFAILGVDRAHDAMIEDELVRRFFPGWDLTRVGDRLVFEMTLLNANAIRELAVRQAQETINNRINAFGVAEPIVHREGIGGDRIVVQLPGVDDPERVKRLIKNTAFLEFRLVTESTGAARTREDLIANYFDGVPPRNADVMVEYEYDDDKNVVGEQYWAVEKRQVITGRDLKTANVTTDEFTQPAVGFTLTHDGGRKFAEVSGENIGRALAIILDGVVISAPTLRDRIADNGIIHGNFTQQEVQDMVTVLRSGALPAGLTYLEERTVGPSLGRDSIDQGLEAGWIGAVFVVLTMLVVYRLTGINAITALALNIVLVFGALATFGATLTVPGIAGIVLTIGMAVDANVLVFERIREELRAGRTVKSAIGAGFSKALSSILDANITTIIAAMFLFIFGTGPIRGFAVTLSIGIVASVFTAVFVSRWIFDLVNMRRQRVEKMSI